jgi:hypothetical protein
VSKARSPQYPAIGLKEAIEKVRLVYAEDYQNKVPRQILVEHMGYQSLNGKSLGVLSAMAKFGLIEGRADENWVSDLALAIIAHDPGTPERALAIKEAASKPDLFSELDLRFAGGKASDAAIRSYLLTQKFIPAAADTAIRSYRETKQLVEAESGRYDEGTPAAANKPNPMQQPQPSQQSRQQPAVPLGTVEPNTQLEEEPYRVSMTKGGGIEIAARIKSQADADEVIQAINAWKVLLRPVSEAKRPSDRTRNRADELADTGDYPGFADIVYQLDVEGHEDAGELLGTQAAREQLNDRCDQARKAKGLPLSARGIPGQR